MWLGSMQLFSAITATAVVTLDGSIAKISPEEWWILAAWTVATLSPILLIFLVRRLCFLLGAIAVLVVPIFLARVHYTLLFVGSRYHFEKGDWALWLNDFFGVLSVVVIAVWMTVWLALFLAGLVSRAIAKRGG